MNCKFFNFFWISLLLFFFNSRSFAQNSNQPTDSSAASAAKDSINDNSELGTDTLIIKTVFDDANDSILKWKQGREFDYMVYLDSLLRKKTGLRIDTVSLNRAVVSRSNATSEPATGNDSKGFLDSFPLRFFFWTVAIFFIGFILYKLFFTGGLFAKGYAKAADEPVNEEPESLNTYSAYNILIREAELKNDFNLSVRYLYLQLLKKLADLELIIFSADKTNNRYIQELANHNYQQEFASLTRNYEYIWYGRFIIDIIRYQKLKEEFIAFNKKI